MIRINNIIEKVSEYYPDADLDVINRAYIYSARVHQGQVRLSGEPYLLHPLEVAGIITEMKLDVVSIASALLHDVIEDTEATKEDIASIFGDEIAHIVSGVSKLSTMPVHDALTRQAESLRKMILAMADDIRVILIKLADRLHNMKTLEFHKPEKRIKIAQETLDIYAPIASRLGIYWIKHELENISFKYINEDEYIKIDRLVQKDKSEREQYINSVKDLISEKMLTAKLPCTVRGRHKQFYSIYQKMIVQDLSFDEVYDIIAFRIILDTIPNCYEALGIIHAMWQPVSNKFKDYIGVPKPNMYQSLHTTVLGPKGERIEIQIRTHEMDRIATSGIAAHWSYKEGKNIKDDKTTKMFAWIQNLVENQENIRDPNEFIENVRIDLFPDDIYVFTPRGEIKTLPKGAAPIDFAYLIHTEVGHNCKGAKINGRMVPITTEINTGDMVEIITVNGSHPSKDWLKFVKTVKARSRIRQWVKIQEKERSISLGREMCDKAFRKNKLNFNSNLNSDQMKRVVSEYNFKTLDDLLASVGYGKITPNQVLRKFEARPNEENDDKSILNRIMGRVRKKKPGAGIVVHGLDDILIRFGKCCQPVPGDAITGYISRGQGVTIHRTSCIHALNMNPERRIDVQWNDSIAETYPVKIRVKANDRIGLLAEITAAISQNNANILSANTETHLNKLAEIFFTISVNDANHLKIVIANLKKIKQVIDVQRVG